MKRINNKTVQYGLIALLFMAIPGNTFAKKKYVILDTTEIQNMEKLKFDIQHYEKNKGFDSFEYIKEDGTRIWQYDSGYGFYVEEEYPPMPKLYYIHREYYLNGNIKTVGFMIRSYFKISIWKYYDEQGNITEKNWDERLGKFDYNKVMLFLNRKGHINIKTGKGREEMTMGFNEDAHCWEVNIWPAESNKYQGVYYMLDKDTGKVKKQEKIWPGH